MFGGRAYVQLISRNLSAAQPTETVFTSADSHFWAVICRSCGGFLANEWGGKIKSNNNKYFLNMQTSPQKSSIGFSSTISSPTSCKNTLAV